MKKAWEQNIALSSVKFVIFDLAGDIFYWPVWWYTQGAAKWSLFCLTKLKNAENYLGLRIWLSNLFTPMYGQYDWQGKLISFFIRLVVLLAKSIIFLFVVILLFILFLSWFILPLIILYQIWFNLKELIVIK